MNKYWLNSTIFNIAFTFVTVIACIVLMPTLLMPREAFLAVVHGWTRSIHILEKWILGLDFDVRGIENMPPDTAVIIASKHQSTYETLKLHILFEDPAIVLKQELIKIPLWGRYLAKIKPIAIDRKNKETAIESIQAGAVRVKDNNRPIIIFPQGTRVSVDTPTSERPYRVGVARMQEATELKIVPIALNTGYFWPKGKWCKRPGTVIFEFLPPIEPGLSREELLTKLEQVTEERSTALLEEAKAADVKRPKTKNKGLLAILALLFILVIGYSFYWFHVADIVREEHSLFLTKSEQIEKLAANNAGKIDRDFNGATVNGFPGPITLNIAKEHFNAPTFQLGIRDIKASSWPFPYMPISIETGPIDFRSFLHSAPIEMDSLEAKFTPLNRRLDLDYAYLKRGTFEIFASGFMTQNDDGTLNEVDVLITIKNAPEYLGYLQEQGILDGQMALFLGAGLNSFKQDGVVTIPLTLKNKMLYAGPFMILKLP